MKNKLKSFLTKNLLLKAVSLLAGFFIWALISNSQNPVTTKSISVPVIYTNEEKLLSEEKLVKVKGPESVTIIVSAKTKSLSRVKPELFTCTADLMTHSGGDRSAQLVHISVTQNGGNDVVLEWSYYRNDPYVTVAMDEYIEKTFTIQPLMQESLTEGLKLENTIEFTPSTVTVKGPKSKFGNVNSVKAVVNLHELSEEGGGIYTSDIGLNMYDSNDNVIPNTDGALTLSASSAVMNAVVARMQSVSVIVRGTVGTPAVGYRYVSSSCTPDLISVYGLKSVVADYSELVIPEEKIDIEGISETTEYTVDVSDYLPEGVFLAEGDGIVTVTIEVEPLESKIITVPVSSISLIGKSSDKSYTIMEESVEVVVRGFREDLDIFNEDSLKPTANLAGLNEGTHKVPVTIVSTTGYIYDNEGKISITVKVTDTTPSRSEKETDDEIDGSDSDETADRPAEADEP